jgi:hypothetical protein
VYSLSQESRRPTDRPFSRPGDKTFAHVKATLIFLEHPELLHEAQAVEIVPGFPQLNALKMMYPDCAECHGFASWLNIFISASVSSPYNEAHHDLVLFCDHILYLMLYVGESATDRIHVLLEPLGSIQVFMSRNVTDKFWRQETINLIHIACVLHRNESSRQFPVVGHVSHSPHVDAMARPAKAITVH